MAGTVLGHEGVVFARLPTAPENQVSFLEKVADVQTHPDIELSRAIDRTTTVSLSC